MNLIKFNNNKGFTMVELLIVLAIIAILAAVAIPIYSSQLENSRVKVDESNLRAATGLAAQDYIVRYAGSGDTVKHSNGKWQGVQYRVLGLKDKTTNGNNISSENMMVYPAAADVDAKGNVLGIKNDPNYKTPPNANIAFKVPGTAGGTNPKPTDADYGAPAIVGGNNEVILTRKQREEKILGDYQNKSVVLFPIQQNNGDGWFIINIGANGVINESKIGLHKK